jgi:hypothetical protein
MVAPMIAAAGIGAAASLLGGLFGNKAAKKQQKFAAQQQVQQQQFVTQNRDYQYNLNAPAIGMGGTADNRIAALLGLGGDAVAAQEGFKAYQGSTGYASRLAEGLGAVNNRSFAGGAGMSGANLKALQERGHNLMGQEFNGYLGQLGGISATGQGARGLVANVGGQAVNQFVGANQQGTANQLGAMQYGAASTQNMIQGLANAGSYALGSSYKRPPMYHTPGM